MSRPDPTGWNDFARDASFSHLPDHIRRAIEITPAAGTSERIIDITTVGRRTGRCQRSVGSGSGTVSMIADGRLIGE